MKVIGITGGIGSGKSRVLSYIEEVFGAVICQADQVAAQLQQPGRECYREIIRVFGTEITAPDGRLDRTKLAGIVFADTEKLRQLNQIVHPAVRDYIQKVIKQERLKGTALFFLETAILFETEYDLLCDEVWYVYAGQQNRRERLKTSRGYSDKKIDQIFAAQLTEETFCSACDKVIDNSGGFEQTRRQLEQAIGELS